MSLSKREAREFLDTVERISDDRVAYFYMMLGSALADATSESRPAAGTQETRANTGPQHLKEIVKRMNS